jgi:flagellar basal body-associated protein FliL
MMLPKWLVYGTLRAGWAPKCGRRKRASRQFAAPCASIASKFVTRVIRRKTYRGVETGMRDNEPNTARPALPSNWRMVRKLLLSLNPAGRLSRILIFTAVICITCGFTVQKTAEQTETAGAAAAPVQEQIDTISTVNCYGERKPGRDYRNCPPGQTYRDRRAYREYRDNGDSREYRDYRPKREEKSRITIPFIVATIVIIGAIAGLIYWLTPPAAPAAEFCIPQAEKTKLVADIAAAFVAARGEATAANILEALPILKLAENGVSGAVNKIKVCPPTC